MKNIGCVVFLLLIVIAAKGSDTLTIRQVYNFSVGDAFDYKYEYRNPAAGYANANYY